MLSFNIAQVENPGIDYPPLGHLSNKDNNNNNNNNKNIYKKKIIIIIIINEVTVSGCMFQTGNATGATLTTLTHAAIWCSRGVCRAGNGASL